MAFRVGQKVVCVDSEPEHGRRWSYNDAPTRGQIYTIAAVGLTDRDMPGVQLVELKRPNAWGYNSNRFRPIVERKTDISALNALLYPGCKILEDAT